jgi:ATP-binding cassette, subfamily B, bacterial PglK
MVTETFDARLWRQGLTIIGPGRKRQFIGLASLAILVALIEASTALIVFALIEMLNDPAALPAFPVVGSIDNIAGSVETTRRVFLLVAAAFFVLRGVLVGFQRYAQARFGESVGREVSVRLFRGYLNMPYEDHLGRNSAELIRNALWSVNEVVINLLIPALAIFSEVIVVVALLATLVIASPLGVAIAVGVVAPIVFVTLRIVQPRLHRLGRRAEDETQMAHRQFSQPLVGIRDVKVFQKQSFFAQRFANARAELARARYLAASLQEAPRLVLETSVFLLVIAVLAFLQADTTSLALLGIFGYALVRLLPGVNRIVGAANRVRFGRAAVENVYGDLMGLSNVLAPEKVARNAPTQVTLQRSIAFEEVSFTYRGSSGAGLDQVSLEISRGDYVGIVGPTGSGKTTLMDILAGLIEPSSGAVLVDGEDIRANLPSWQSKIGLVPQTVFLIDDTLRNNIALGLDEAEIDEAALWDAVEAAQLSEFVQSLPDGLDALVGERGVRVSGGQRQRVSIARALYPRPEVLLFDEGTAALDTVTEAALLNALEGLRGEYTMVSIAHRLATVRNCSRIFLLMGGRMVDTGTYEELVARNPTFERMAR